MKTSEAELRQYCRIQENIFQDKVAGAVFVYNAFGKLLGSTQVAELGQIETPIVLTNTPSVWDAAAAVASWTLAQPGNEDIAASIPSSS